MTHHGVFGHQATQHERNGAAGRGTYLRGVGRIQQLIARRHTEDRVLSTEYGVRNVALAAQHVQVPRVRGNPRDPEVQQKRPGRNHLSRQQSAQQRGQRQDADLWFGEERLAAVDVVAPERQLAVSEDAAGRDLSPDRVERRQIARAKRQARAASLRLLERSEPGAKH